MGSPATIDVWRLKTDLPASELRTLRAVLSPHERARAAGGGARKERWTAGRAALRMVLSSYLECEPAAVEFEQGPHGKPSVRGLEFSFAGSGAEALVAVSRDGPVGVDVERVDARRPVWKLARRLFAPAEVAALRSLPPDRLAAAFHDCWAAKEAYAKGRGQGLAFGFDTFSVAALLRSARRVCVGGFAVERLAVSPGYAAAVCAPGPRWRCRTRTWNRAS